MARKRRARKDIGTLFLANKVASTLLVLFIPSHDRNHRPINQDYLVSSALECLGELFGGATAYPRGKGVWRDDVQGGELLFDEPVVIQCYTTEALIERHAAELRAFLIEMGSKCGQGAVGFVIDQDYLEIAFPLQKEAT